MEEKIRLTVACFPDSSKCNNSIGFNEYSIKQDKTQTSI